MQTETEMRMDLSSDVTSGKLSPHIARLMEMTSAKLWSVTFPDGATSYMRDEDQAHRVAGKFGGTINAPSAV